MDELIEANKNPPEVTAEEIQNEAIGSNVTEKSPNDENIPAKLLQTLDLGPTGHEELRILINDIYTRRSSPKDFTSGTLIPIPKVNKATQFSDQYTIKHDLARIEAPLGDRS